MSYIKLMVSVTILALFLSGCYSEKILRTKPTTFIDVQSSVATVSETLEYICISPEEEPIVKSDVRVCTDYISVTTQNIKALESMTQGELANKLFYISDNNCKKFVERFKYNYIKQDVTGKFFKLNLFALSFDIGTVADLTNEQFVQFNDTLNENLNKRKAIKESIFEELNKEESSLTTDALVNWFVKYDQTCSLVKTFD